MASADEVWCQLFSEPDAGSDLGSLRTKAIWDGEVWRITGTKVWSTWAQFADKGLLLARTGPLETRHRTIGAFVIDMDQPGIEVRPLVTMTGAAEFAEVAFDDAVVRPEDVVGERRPGMGGGDADARERAWALRDAPCRRPGQRSRRGSRSWHGSAS